MKNAPPKKKPAGKTKKAPAKKTKNKKIDTSPAAIRRRIRARNARFKRLTPSQKRIAIAQDVIEQLDARAIRAKTSIYFRSKDIQKVIDRVIKAKDQIGLDEIWGDKPDPTTQRVLAQDGEMELCDLFSGNKSCTVCGIGAAFVSAVRLADNLKIKNLSDADEHAIDDSTMRGYLKQYFAPAQVALIECAFEMDESFRYEVDEWPSSRDADAAADFGCNYQKHVDRMRAIFQNIIDNNGTFNPSASQDGAS